MAKNKDVPSNQAGNALDALKAIEAEYAVKMAEAKKAVAEEAEPTIRDAVDTLKAMNEFAPDLV